MQEGININKGLLALGNVISALTDEKRGDGARELEERGERGAVSGEETWLSKTRVRCSTI